MSSGVLALSIPNRIAELSASMDRVEAFLAEADVDPGDSTQVMIMLDEIASNIIKTAWPADEEHRFDVTLTLEPGGKLLLLATDDGAPFDPTAGDPPDLDATLEDRVVGGLGLFIVGEMSDSMEYSRVDGHNRLLVTKQTGGSAC
jgi:anti-sigma regulatory factor (Ser/Thr protein kinase)